MSGLSRSDLVLGSKTGLEAVQHTPAPQPIPTVIGPKQERRRDTLNTRADAALQRKLDPFQWPRYPADELYILNKVLNEQDVPPVAFLHELQLDAYLIRPAASRSQFSLDRFEI